MRFFSSATPRSAKTFRRVGGSSIWATSGRASPVCRSSMRSGCVAETPAVGVKPQRDSWIASARRATWESVTSTTSFGDTFRRVEGQGPTPRARIAVPLGVSPGVPSGVRAPSWTEEVRWREYLSRVIEYGLGPAQLEGLEHFFFLLGREGLHEGASRPLRFVGGSC